MAEPQKIGDLIAAVIAETAARERLRRQSEEADKGESLGMDDDDWAAVYAHIMGE